MIGYVMVGARNRPAAAAVYDAIVKEMGVGASLPFDGKPALRAFPRLGRRQGQRVLQEQLWIGLKSGAAQKMFAA